MLKYQSCRDGLPRVYKQVVLLMTLLCVLIPGQGCRKDTEAEEEDQKELREIENFLMTFEDWKQEDEPWQKV